MTGDVDQASPADTSRVVWVIDPDTRKIFFTGPVLHGDGQPYTNAAFRVVDTTDAPLGTVTTDANGWLGDSLMLPEGWDRTTNFEVRIVIPGGAGTQYTEGATTIENPVTPDPQEGGHLTEADPQVDSATDSGLDRDRVPEDRAVVSVSASASVSASVSVSASASASASASPSASPSASTEPWISATTSALPSQPAVVPGGDTDDEVHDLDASPSASPPAELSDGPAMHDQVPVSIADRTHAPRPTSSASAHVPLEGPTGTPVDRSARYVTERLPRTGGPAVIFGLVGLAVTVSGATLLGTSLSGRSRGGTD